MQYTLAQQRDLYLLTDYLDEVRYTQAEFDRELHWVMIEDLIEDCFKQYYTFLADSFTLQQWYDLFRKRCYGLARQQDFDDNEAREVVDDHLKTMGFKCLLFRVSGSPNATLITSEDGSIQITKL